MLTSSSFKLQKLTRSMEMKSDSLSKTQMTTTPRLSAAISVAKSVKYNNLSFIAGQQTCKLRRQPQEGLQDPQYSSAHQNMANIRKRYDKTNQQKLYYDNKIFRLQQELKKFKDQQQQFQTNKIQGKSQVNKLEAQLEIMRLKLEEKYFEKSTMDQMAGAIKYDKIVYDRRKFQMQKYLKHSIFRLKSLKQSTIHINQQDDRTLKVYQKLLSRIASDQHERAQHINSLSQRICQRQVINNSTTLRMSMMGQIAQEAMTDRSTEQKQWLKVFGAQKFLQKMLKAKIEREMGKFEIVETAFKNIKIATGVEDASAMVSKFLSKQRIYGDLLSKIADNEKQIELLKHEHETLLKEIKQNEDSVNLLQITKGPGNNLREQMKLAQQIEEKRKRGEFQKTKLKQLLHKQQKVFTNMFDQQQQPQQNPIQKKDLKNRLIQHLTKLNGLLDKTLELEDPGESNPLDYPNTQQETFTKLFRIKPLVKNQQNSQMPNSYIQNYEEEQILGNDQGSMIEDQRYNIIKGNEKFMKELKQKANEAKQAIIQNLVKNTKEKVVVAATTKKAQNPIEQ